MNNSHGRFLMRKLVLFSVLVLFVISGVSAGYVQFDFSCITNNNLTNAIIGQTQFTVSVTNEGLNGDEVMFVFENLGPEQSSISEIYFDDGPPELLSFNSFKEISVINDISFEVGATPGNLPGGQGIAFTADHIYQPNNPEPKNGINSGESLGIVFTLFSGTTFSDVIAAIQGRDLAVGIHAIGFENGGSESFVMVPEPSTFSLIFMGLFMIGFVRLRKKK